MNRPETFPPRVVRSGWADVDRDDDDGSPPATNCGLIVAWPEERARTAASSSSSVSDDRARSHQTQALHTTRAHASTVEPLFPGVDTYLSRPAGGGGGGGDPQVDTLAVSARRERRRQRQAGGVRFHGRTDVLLVELVEERTSEENDAMWYTEEDYRTIKKQARATVKFTTLVERKGHDATDEQRRLARRLCMRGLEHMASYEANQQRRILKDSVVEAVLLEQEQEGDGRSGAGLAVAAASMAASKPARDLAASMAALDAATALAYVGSQQSTKLSASSLRPPASSSQYLASALASVPCGNEPALTPHYNNGAAGDGGSGLFADRDFLSNSAPRRVDPISAAAPCGEEEERLRPRCVSLPSLDSRHDAMDCDAADAATCKNGKRANSNDGKPQVQKSRSADILSRLRELRGGGRAAAGTRQHRTWLQADKSNDEWSINDAKAKPRSSQPMIGRMFLKRGPEVEFRSSPRIGVDEL